MVPFPRAKRNGRVAGHRAAIGVRTREERRLEDTAASGHSSPVLTATRIFVTAHTPEKEQYKLFVICLDRQTGKTLWQREVPRTREGTAAERQRTGVTQPGH